MFGYDWPRLHAALNDLPAALLVVAVLFDLAAALTKRPVFREVGYWTMLAGVVGAAAAVLSGLQAEDHIAHGEAVHQVMETHETLAWVTLGVFAVVALWRLVRESTMSRAERGGSLALSLIGLGAVVATGSYGGKLVFEHAAGIPTPVLQEEMHERSEGHHHGAADGHDDDREDDHDVPGTAAGAAPHRDPPGSPPHTH